MNDKYKRMFKDVKAIADSLSKKELYHICGGTFKDSPYIRYRDVYYDGNKPVGFIDVYGDYYEGVIVLAVLKEYRGQGIASKLVKKMEAEYPHGSTRYLIWKTDIDNVESQRLAVKLGYKLSSSNSKEKVYRKDNPNYKGIKLK